MKPLTPRNKKKLVVLPEDFAEVLILHEMKYEKEEVNVDIIRKLIYLYSLGMEYYDSINKSNLHEFYFDKLNRLLMNANVVDLLDKNKSHNLGFNENLEDINLFNESPYQIVKPFRKRSLLETSSSYFLRRLEEDHGLGDFVPTDTSQTHRKNSHLDKIATPVKTKFNNLGSADLRISSSNKSEQKMICKQKVFDQFDLLDNKLKMITKNIFKDISEQKTKFEQMKKKKLDKQHTRNNRKNNSCKDLEYKINYISNLSTVVSINEEDLVINYFKEKDPEKDINQHINQSLMLKEIEDYIDKNITEMHKALKELRISFEDEMNSLDDEVFPELVNGLKEDMKVELEDLREQYEEQTRVEVEKIRTKYLKLILN